MSKIIESLKTGAKEFAKKSNHELTQEQLADIYFSGPEKAKKSDTPMVIKVIEKPRTASLLLPWLIASIAFFITAFSLFSTKRIFVDIKVIDEKNPYLAALYDEAGRARLAGGQAEAIQKEEAGGTKLPLQNFIFEGAAKLKSAKSPKDLTLVNSSIAPFARASTYFETPQNLSRSKIIFYAKGAKGGENIAFALKDRENIQAFDKGVLHPFPKKLTTDWQRGEVLVQDAAKEFNERSVVSMRFEFGSRVSKNKPGDTIFIRDLQVVPV